MTYDTTVAADSPAAWWKLADAAGTTAADSSGNAHTGTAASVTFGQSGAPTGDNSALFNGSSSGITTAYLPSGLITVECWVNLNGNTQSGNPRLITCSHTDHDFKGFELFLTGPAPFAPQLNVGGGGTAWASATATATIASTGWYYIAGTYDGTTISVYVNAGTPATAAFAASMPAGADTGISLGYNSGYSGDYLHGLLAEAAVYTTVLTSAKISAHYSAATGGGGARAGALLAAMP